MPPHAEIGSVVLTDARSTPLGRQVRRKGHFKVPGVAIRRAVRGVPTVWRQHQSSQSLTRFSPGRVDAQTSCRNGHAGASNATTILSAWRRRALESAQVLFQIRAYRNCCVEFARGERLLGGNGCAGGMARTWPEPYRLTIVRKGLTPLSARVCGLRNPEQKNKFPGSSNLEPCLPTDRLRPQWSLPSISVCR